METGCIEPRHYIIFIYYSRLSRAKSLYICIVKLRILKEDFIIENKTYKVWISLINNLGFKKYKNLIQRFKSNQGIWNATKNELLKVEGIGEKTADLIVNKKLKEYMKKHIEYIDKNNIDIIGIEDKEYPTLLKNIYDPPICLYIKGDKSILNNISISIIGCREATNYGIKVAKEFAYNISKQKINIISGLAKGIDSAAHLGAVEANEKTVAVLGNGLDTIYPKENKNLAQKILDSGGAIISEYPLGTFPKKENFPARNRIISGLSNSLLVVEAKEKSGTLITVDFALEQGRDVFVVPGNISSINSVGTNDLIKQGAKLVTNWNECLK